MPETTPRRTQFVAAPCVEAHFVPLVHQPGEDWRAFLPGFLDQLQRHHRELIDFLCRYAIVAFPHFLMSFTRSAVAATKKRPE
ncbi:hypothetical protein [Mesorhizobium sp. B1-1-5]|uniref:hypothetical protein n=1 Tax=Mesorhizobium sp. B1-1-5 TaxID=2589979 RepID=UPI00112EC042|nr:hypothetical protein [Mesorhizobium sp. B1-1-5]TPO02188.1 hypothetical protein FJ980_18705 [Mesorhizobium sp. B1-1-5]